MERIEYERLAAVEDRMWWTRALRRNLLAAAERSLGAPYVSVLDAGCGAGGLLAAIANDWPKAMGTGLDRDGFACRLARDKSRRPVARGSVDALPFRDAAFDLVFSADVLCHRGVEPAGALREMRRCLKPGGALVLNLPAYRWLFSAHDRAVDNARRYRRAEVAVLLSAAGFTGIRATYWNTVLFPLMVARRRLWPDGSDVALLPSPLERLFDAIAIVESTALKTGLRLPFGGSILAVGTRP